MADTERYLWFSAVSSLDPSEGGAVELLGTRFRWTKNAAALRIERLLRENAVGEARALERYVHRGATDGVTHEGAVDGETWQRIWGIAERIGAWTWRGEYSPSGQLDGYTWVLEMRRDSRHMNCEGHWLDGPPDGLSVLVSALEALSGLRFGEGRR